MQYDKIFDPDRAPRDADAGRREGAGDRRDGAVYVYHDENIVLAVNVALATSRPLLVGGPPGSGKSSLAESIADLLGWRYVEHVVSSRTQARDLLWTFDAVRRLQDAQAGELRDRAAYVRRGPLWEAFDAPAGGTRAVVLLDEIDKADPDVPNSLLVPLGSFTFIVTDLDEEPEARATPETAPLIVVTTNDERDLSKPFLRRCVVLMLPEPGVPELLRIAQAHGLAERDGLHEQVAQLVDDLRKEARQDDLPVPSTAEYLDALRACAELGVRPPSAEWDALVAATLRKRVDPAARAE